MYPKKRNQFTVDDFILPFGGKLDPNNRWVRMAELIPWEELEKEYASNFSYTGNPAKELRMALGSLIIKEKNNLTDEETVYQITENPYLQYFIGLKEFTTEPPFDPSLMPRFRKRITPEMLKKANDSICSDASSDKDDDSNDDNEPPSSNSDNEESSEVSTNDESSKNKGKLLIDGSCAPADISYPTDISLLNEAREKTEAIIDTLHAPLKGQQKKPRTYRKKARKQYLSIAKKRTSSKREIRKAIKKQLGYINRNLAHIENLQANISSGKLSKKQLDDLVVIKELYEQQKYMLENKINHIENRIVSIDQPHVRPIVRGKANNETEFGAKFIISVVDGYNYLEILEWENYHEGTKFPQVIENYYSRFGCYPQKVVADKAYRSRENRDYCKSRGIQLSGPPLGRPKEDQKKEQKAIEAQDARERNEVEGALGTMKRKYGLDRVMTKLKETSENTIALAFIVKNLDRKLASIFYYFLRCAFFNYQRAEYI